MSGMLDIPSDLARALEIQRPLLRHEADLGRFITKVLLSSTRLLCRPLD